MSFDKYIHSCNHHHNHRVFLLSQKVPWCSFAISLLLRSWPQATTNQPSVTIAFAGSKSSYKLNHMVFTLLYLAPLSPHNGFEINSGSLSIYSSFLFIAKQYSTGQMYHGSFNNSAIEGHLYSLQFGAINKCSMNIPVQVSE